MEHVKIKPFNVIGISVRTTNENNKAAKDLTDLWNEFFSAHVLEAIPNKVDHTVYCIYTEYERDHTRPYTAILGCKVTTLATIPDHMVGKSFDGGNYIKLSARGNLMNDLIINKWLEIWKMDLNRAFTADFEVFDKKSQNPADAEIDFLIAVK